MAIELSLFTSPKPFNRPLIETIQRNAIESWTRLGPGVEVLLIGDEVGMVEAAHDFGVRHLKGVDKNAQGTPLVSSIFSMAEQEASHNLLTYVNADILLLDDFLPSVQRSADRFDRFMMVGQRWDLELEVELTFEKGWASAMRKRLEARGALHPPAGSDYFVFPRGQFGTLPPFALGRAGWDNWMIFNARRLRIPVIDASRSTTVVHQTHDYDHLEGGGPHYRLPESQKNVELGGGPETIFTLADANWRLNGHGLSRATLKASGLRRWAEVGVITRLDPGRRLRLVHSLFHPIEAAQWFWTQARRRVTGGAVE
ncbi:MAG: hypothetical protein J4N76_11720 [Chloroflexi bacterium]|nr:hypothetical protein [Chloroflexota bacterium]MCI0773846.1 hypothetical protein [Chloroflexota bacterium]MCI0854974.1 hypothetical protein [Chloroflexota bacterium]MCI0877213.1 hypothetical protein [Chloroflexota bacterium]MCI0892726.1 hypothetical protein [Chloroflexota bacterium]